MKKSNNIKHTLQIIRNLPLPIAYQRIERWVMEYEEEKVITKRIGIISNWLLIKYRIFNWWKK